jgi:hypothetical protein
LQQLPTARRGRSENELRSGTALFHAWDLIPLRCSVRCAYACFTTCLPCAWRTLLTVPFALSLSKGEQS